MPEFNNFAVLLRQSMSYLAEAQALAIANASTGIASQTFGQHFLSVMNGHAVHISGAAHHRG